MRYMLQCSVATFPAAFLVQPAMGQDAQSGEEQATARSSVKPDGLGEIVVTARRREEVMQNVPVAITAFSGDQLAQANITRIENLDSVTAGLTIAPTNGRANIPGFTMRGQRQNTVFLTNDSAVGIYFNEAVQARAFGLAQAMYDIESVQVLKGPQGTLFGRNTTGGAILFQSRQPTFDGVGGYMQGRLGNYGRLDLQGAVNLPINDVLALRLATNRTRMDGYVHDLTTGKTLYAEHTDNYRGTLLIEPDAILRNTLYIDYFKSDASGSGGKLLEVNPTSPANTLFGASAILAYQQANLGFYDVQSDSETISTGTNFGVTNNTVLDLNDNVTVKNIFNFRRVKSNEAQDFDGTEQRILSVTIDSADVKQISEELQFQYHTSDDRLNVVAGGYYFQERGSRYVVVSALGQRGGDRRQTAQNSSYSGFAQADFKITDQLTATFGGRYTKEKRDFAQDYVTYPAGDCIVCYSRSASWGAFTYTANLAFQIDPDKLVYLATRKGFRSGGFNSSASTYAATNAYDPEYVTDYELGLKADWYIAGAQVRTNVAAYYSNYNDIQRSIIKLVGNSPVVSVFNAAKAAISGVEAEVKFIPVKGLELNGSLAYTHPHYKDFEYDSGAGPIDQSDNTFAFVPHWTYQLAAKAQLYEGRDGRNTVTASASYYHQSRIYTSEFNSAHNLIKGYGLLGARLEVENVGGTKFDFAFWARNLGGRKYFQATADQYSSLGIVYGFPGEPRTYGAEVAVHF